MDCPIDGSELRITERSGVEIDYCPKCRGVWLDRGELDKIIDRAAPEVVGGPVGRDRDWDDRYRRDDRHRDDRHRDDRHRDDDWDDRRGHRRKKRGFLGDIFDFD